jgi:hypothetical protein
LALILVLTDRGRRHVAAIVLADHEQLPH